MYIPVNEIIAEHLLLAMSEEQQQQHVGDPQVIGQGHHPCAILLDSERRKDNNNAMNPGTACLHTLHQMTSTTSNRRYKFAVNVISEQPCRISQGIPESCYHMCYRAV